MDGYRQHRAGTVGFAVIVMLVMAVCALLFSAGSDHHRIASAGIPATATCADHSDAPAPEEGHSHVEAPHHTLGAAVPTQLAEPAVAWSPAAPAAAATVSVPGATAVRPTGPGRSSVLRV